MTGYEELIQAAREIIRLYDVQDIEPRWEAWLWPVAGRYVRVARAFARLRRAMEEIRGA